MSCAAATAPTVSAASGTTGMLSFFHILAALIDQINTIGCDQCQYHNIGHHNLSPFFLSFPVHLASIIQKAGYLSASSFLTNTILMRSVRNVLNILSDSYTDLV